MDEEVYTDDHDPHAELATGTYCVDCGFFEQDDVQAKVVMA